MTKLKASPHPVIGRTTKAIPPDAVPGRADDEPAVAVRPYGPDDKAAVLGMRLSRQSLQNRFFVGSPHLPFAYAGMLARVDHWDREALLALAGTEVIGVAEYVRDRALPRTADLAVMVSDAWQRRGVARRLLVGLTALARERGIDALRADVLAGNGAAIAAVRRGWPNASAVRAEGGAVAYRLPLG